MATFIMLIGLPASGKGYLAEQLSIEYNATIHSSDKIRGELFGDCLYQDENEKVFLELHKRIKLDLIQNNSVIYDACNISYRKRMSFLSELKNIPCTKICYLVCTEYLKCLEQNKERENNVPEYVIKRMYKNFTIPYWYEGWDEIKLHYSYATLGKQDPLNFPYSHLEYDQHSPYHYHTLGEHLFKTWDYIKDTLDTTDNTPLHIAAILHDCGKPFTQEFYNTQNILTNNAKYYNHHNVGAYDSLFYKTLTNPLEHAIIIFWHTQPYWWESNKVNGEDQRLKYHKLWGNTLYENIMLLHKADRFSH